MYEFDDLDEVKCKELKLLKKGHYDFETELKRIRSLKKRHDYVKFNSEYKKKKNLFYELLRVYSYLKLDNKSRAIKIIENIYSVEMYEHLVNNDVANIRFNIIAHENFIELLELIGELLEDNLYFDNLIRYFFLYSSDRFKEMLDDTFDISTSYNYILKRSNSFQYGYKAPFIWGIELFEKHNEEQYKSYIKKSGALDKVFENSRFLLFYRGLKSVPKNNRKKFISKVEGLLSSKDFYIQSIYFRILEEAHLYKVFRSHSKVKIGLLLKKQRQIYYQHFYKKTELQSFLLFELFRIGDENEEYYNKWFQNYE